MPLLSTGYVRIKKTVDGAWVDLPTPATDGVSYEIQTTVTDARNSAGIMVGVPVGQDKIKLNIKYPPLTDDQLSGIMRLFDREQGGQFFVFVEFYDPRVQQRVVRLMYVGDRSFDPYIVEAVEVGKPRYWINCQCNLIEC